MIVRTAPLGTLRRAAMAAAVAAVLPALTAPQSAAQTPGEATDLAFCEAQRDCLEWTPGADAGAHRLYRGEPAALPGLLDLGTDACLRSTHVPPDDARVTLLEAPGPGGLFWYLAVGADSPDPAAEEGPAGDARDGATGMPLPRSLDSTGACPFACNPDYRPQPNVVAAEPPGIGGCLPGMAPVASFCIDRWEAALVHAGDANDGEPHSPFFNPGDAPVRAISAPGALPQSNISGVQAAAACARAGKRLCTDAEWLRACQGPTGTTWPYGDTQQPGVCNDQRAEHPAIEYFQTTEPWIWSELDHPCLNQLFDGLARGGAHAGCVTFEGAFDMAGNLAEWTADPAGTFRGGHYVESTINGEGCLYRTTAHGTQHFDFTTGFRCCADP